jgi:hypothetical protein
MRKLILACIAAMALLATTATSASADVEVWSTSPNAKCSELQIPDNTTQWSGGCAVTLSGQAHIGAESFGYAWSALDCGVTASGKVGGGGLLVLTSVSLSGLGSCASKTVCDTAGGWGNARWVGRIADDPNAVMGEFAAQIDVCVDDYRHAASFEGTGTSSGFGLNLYAGSQTVDEHPGTLDYTFRGALRQTSTPALKVLH